MSRLEDQRHSCGVLAQSHLGLVRHALELGLVRHGKEGPVAPPSLS